MKLGVPLLFNLYTNPLEDSAKPTVESWIVEPVLKMVGEFEASVKTYPLIPMGTPILTPREGETMNGKNDPVCRRARFCMRWRCRGTAEPGGGQEAR